jgi:DNA-binding MarR family transcriptional regulator
MIPLQACPSLQPSQSSFTYYEQLGMTEEFIRDEQITGAMDSHRAIVKALGAGTEQAWGNLELTMRQLQAVLVLGRSGRLASGFLARELGIGLPAASQLVDRLVEQGQVERREDPADRRRTIVSLTPAAESMVAHLLEGSREVLESWMRRLTPEDLDRLARGLAALAEVAAAQPRPALIAAR